MKFDYLYCDLQGQLFCDTALESKHQIYTTPNTCTTRKDNLIRLCSNDVVKILFDTERNETYSRFPKIP